MDHARAALLSVPGIKNVWFTECEEQVADLKDVDGDGLQELFVYTSGRIKRLDWRNREIWMSEGFASGTGNDSGLVVEDLDGDGSWECIFNGNGHLTCLDAGTGRIKWQKKFEGSKHDRQGSLVGHFTGPKTLSVMLRVLHDVWVYDAAGKQQWHHRLDYSGDPYGHEMGHCDLDGDGREEVLITLPGRVVAIGSQGQELWRKETKNHSDFILGGDLDEDGRKEVVFDHDGCGGKGPIRVVDALTGADEQEWPYRKLHPHLQRAILADFQPDQPGLELVGTERRSRKGGMTLWDNKGNVLWHKPEVLTEQPTLGDWNGDGTPEILLTQHGRLQFSVWNGKGERLYALGLDKDRIALPGGAELGLWTGRDLDGNGKADVLIQPLGSGTMILFEQPDK